MLTMVWELLSSKKFWIALLVGAAVVFALHLKGKYDRAIADVAAWEQRDDDRKRADAVRAAHDLKNKERTDEENRRSHAALQRELGRLRALPVAAIAPAPASSKCPDGQICFDAAEFDAARGRFYSELREVAGQCTALAVDMQSARDWANGD